MRKHYIQVLKSFFHNKLFHTREALGITQEEMARRLAMAARTYVDLDHGKTSCSALTLALFLIYICADPTAFLKELRDAFEAIDNKAA
jgi:DNA-binding XRE family transcriptional regulator